MSTTLERITAIIKEHNPCRFEKVDGKVKCCGKGNDYTPCCNGCKHLTTNGCSVTALACKFYFCKWSWDNLPQEAQHEVKNIINENQEPLMFRHDLFKLTNYDLTRRLGEVPYKAYR